MILQCVAPLQCCRVPHNPTTGFAPRKSSSSPETVPVTPPFSSLSTTTRRRALSLSFISVLISFLAPSCSSSAISDFSELLNSGRVRALDLRLGSGEAPTDGDQSSL
ncbi:hypothetical protein L484_005680 [Morus notabilis]|uniref:Uncharacterized protein n=1 Tax=Morus notabilis TaxID=981085 RepID=W9RLV1_9ROSA|nr:hypothetical protein L484_005680 [Morus notabilis]